MIATELKYPPDEMRFKDNKATVKSYESYPDEPKSASLKSLNESPIDKYSLLYKGQQSSSFHMIHVQNKQREKGLQSSSMKRLRIQN